MGLDLGFELAGFEVRAVVEHDRAAVKTIQANRPSIPVLKDGERPAAIEDLTTAEVLEAAGLDVGEPTVLIGAPPCEPYSTAGRRNGKQDYRAGAVMEYIRVIREAQPEFFVVEQVDSFRSASKKHVGFYERIARGDDDLTEDERLGSFFDEVMQAFDATGYSLSYDPEDPKRSVLNAADFGVPQRRKRFILIGAREAPAVSLPEPTCGEPVTLRQALEGLEDPDPETRPFPHSWGQYLKLVPEGGCWRDLPKDLHKTVLGGAYDDPTDPKTYGKKGGRTGFMRRLRWDSPAPTLTDSPITKGSCLCHPDDDRPLSVREYARLQGFPASWVFCGSIAAKYRLIGQATPVQMARTIAAAIAQHRMDVAAKSSSRPEEGL